MKNRYDNYFDNNAPYEKRNSHDYKRDDAPRKKSHFLLPPPAILEAYEEMSPGSTERIIDMAENEQAHRHNWEDRALTAYIWSNRLGMLFGSIVAIAIVSGTLYLASMGDRKAALNLCAFGFASLTISSLVTLKVRKFERKPRKLRENFEAASKA